MINPWHRGMLSRSDAERLLYRLPCGNVILCLLLTLTSRLGLLCCQTALQFQV